MFTLQTNLKTMNSIVIIFALVFLCWGQVKAPSAKLSSLHLELAEEMTFAYRQKAKARCNLRQGLALKTAVTLGLASTKPALNPSHPLTKLPFQLIFEYLDEKSIEQLINSGSTLLPPAQETGGSR